jgi:3'-phosphoadenosine 5'-phosphosulfate sulfotransferase (PAPS reductase)/FAD synthetase
VSAVPKAMAAVLKDGPVTAFFSTGKDSIVMCDLLFRAGINFIPVFMYFVDGLSFIERILTAYERRWNKRIERVPHFTAMNLKAGTKKYKMADVETGLRNQTGASWIALGYKKNDGMARRGMPARLPYGIDERNRKLYPVADWSDRRIMSYIKLHKLPLPVEYNFMAKQGGQSHDLSVPDAMSLLMIKRNFPSDYKKIIAEFPRLDAYTWAAENRR